MFVFYVFILLLVFLFFLSVFEEGLPIVGVPKNMEEGDDGHSDAELYVQEFDRP